MDPSYCSVWNGDREEEKEPKSLVLELLPAEAVQKLQQAAEVSFSITNVNPEQFGGGIAGCDLESYAHERLDGGLFQTGQKFELLCNGRQERVEVLKIKFLTDE